MSDKNSSDKQRTFLFNLSYIGGNNQHKNNYEHLELIYQFYASAISNSNFVIENFRDIPRPSRQHMMEIYTRGGGQRVPIQSTDQDQDKDKKEEGDKQMISKRTPKMSTNQILMRLHRKNE